MTDSFERFESPQGRSLAYERVPGEGPGIVFLGGFRSDMAGTKAAHLSQWARARGRAFLRFDYSGHGASSGTFEEGAIGDWAEDAVSAISALTTGPQILVGSSMGGWIALLVSRAVPERVAGMVGIAAAPDFTEDAMWAGMTREERVALEEEGRVEQASEYSDAPNVITRRLIEDGRRHLVLRDPLSVPGPVRLLQGTADAEVDRSVALRLLDHVESPDVRLTLVKGADHRFSSPECLALIEGAIAELLVETGA
ncbi:Pimeloyl-ACP methyl ester carboxylesterase [Tranquillimonas rosea]|uniref:Palmitoyl-protein thioesterase ABHD10, mitochondrial n=1 Tax=Tranquillimonas rosea TaxID=641238 RepID=A0A1H9WDS7_9RHOB|nr:alpha/beta hydrolase [Tranquillimonas rosea]SES31613.1 Pimeloyl-ACP methyl ester carboxylesterase [Tranquillimonas rosea]